MVAGFEPWVYPTASACRGDGLGASSMAGFWGFNYIMRVLGLGFSA